MKQDLSKCYSQFDAIYKIVTKHIKRYRAERIRDWHTGEWIIRLVNRFQDERHQWPEKSGDSPDTNAYFEQLPRFHVSFYRLAACAYFHISYDLPRVIADEWPGKNKWKYGPDFDSAESAYFELAPLFPSAFQEGIRKWEVAGVVALAGSIMPSGAVAALCNWMLHLRSFAWIQARRLEKCENRVFVESQMLVAMTIALRQVRNLKPWTLGGLTPPPLTVLFPLPFSLTFFDAERPSWLVPLGLTVAIMIILIAKYFTLIRNWARAVRELFKPRYTRENNLSDVISTEMELFVHELGERILLFMSVAVNDPHELARVTERYEGVFLTNNRRFDRE